MYCSKCGAENKDDSLFCTKCGEKILDVNVKDDKGAEIKGVEKDQFVFGTFVEYYCLLSACIDDIRDVFSDTADVQK